MIRPRNTGRVGRGLGQEWTISQGTPSGTDFYVPPINVTPASGIDLGTPPTVTATNPTGIVNPTVTTSGTSLIPNYTLSMPGAPAGTANYWPLILGAGAFLVLLTVVKR